MVQNKFKFKSKIDGLEISGLRIEPDNKSDIKGIVQLVHGMCEHKERYIEFMEYLAKAGYHCVIHDHRGHGESIKAFDDRGYMYEGGDKALVEDTHEVTLLTKDYVNQLLNDENYVNRTSNDNYVNQNSGPKQELPYILLGHSMGSLVVRCYIKKYDAEIDKLAVLGCPSKLPGMKTGLMLINVLKAIRGGHVHSKLVDNLVSGSNYEKRFAHEKLSHAWLNTDKQEVQKYLDDPFCNFTFTLNGYASLVRLTMETYSAGNYAMANKAMPVYFFSGSDDPCAISWDDLAKAMDVMKKAGYDNVQGKMYESMRHEILLEPEHMKVYKDILDFIES